jgi:hypothetical protein
VLPAVSSGDSSIPIMLKCSKCRYEEDPHRYAYATLSGRKSCEGSVIRNLQMIRERVPQYDDDPEASGNRHNLIS